MVYGIQMASQKVISVLFFTDLNLTIWVLVLPGNIEPHSLDIVRILTQTGGEGALQVNLPRLCKYCPSAPFTHPHTFLTSYNDAAVVLTVCRCFHLGVFTLIFLPGGGVCSAEIS